MNELIKPDNLSTILSYSKADCEAMQTEIKGIVIDTEPKITFQNYSALKKLYDIIDKVLKDEETKSQARAGFLNQFGGSKTELVYGYKTTLTQTGEYEYSQELQKELEDYKADGEILTAKKELERKQGIAKLIDTKENLSFTLK
jgi:hypothetical protein